MWTGTCKGVCARIIEQAWKSKIDVLICKPNLEHAQSYYEIAERYYQRNRELIEKCNFVYAFVSEKGLTGGTGFEVKYALKLGKPVRIYTEGKASRTIYQPELFSVDIEVNPAWRFFLKMFVGNLRSWV